jgi:signal transduction histidine kinase
LSNLGKLGDFSLAPARGAGADSCLRDELTEVVQLGLNFIGAVSCAIAYSDGIEEGVVQAPAIPLPWVGIEQAVLQLKPAQTTSNRFEIVRHDASEFVSHHKNAALFADRFEMLAAIAIEDLTWTVVGVLCDSKRHEAVSDVCIKLLSRLATAITARSAYAAARNFWRDRAAASAADASSARQQISAIDSDRRWVERALRQIVRLEPRRRLQGIGESAAELGRCDAWIVARVEKNVLNPAHYFGLPAVLPFEGESALAESFNRRGVIFRDSSGNRTKIYCEDRLFADAGFASYLCAPLYDGAVAVAARKQIDWPSRSRIEALLSSLAPVEKAWALETEAARQRTLIRSLTLRMLSAGDVERARIARDLHDDHAQLLSAARIALSAPGGGAARLLEQLEKQLRSKMMSLRPASLGRQSLERAIEFELRRLEAAGVEVAFVGPGNERRMTRPIQQVCYHIVREAVSNIIRHACARRVEIALERKGKSARLTITDDGRGVGKQQAGAGLRGLAERVEFLGGRCVLESKPGRTRLVAEIPEFGR